MLSAQKARDMSIGVFPSMLGSTPQQVDTVESSTFNFFGAAVQKVPQRKFQESKPVCCVTVVKIERKLLLQHSLFR